MEMHKDQKGQASLDLLISYGVAILVISIALYVVLQLGIFNQRLAPTYCNAAPDFICTQIALNTSGGLTIIFSQATGGTLNIHGAACDTQSNTISFGPEYGNFDIKQYSAAPQFYPNNQLQNGLVVYSSNQTRIFVNCYSGSGISKGSLGNAYSGYVWINYTLNTLPNNYHTVEQMVSFSTKYT
jgi:hypothetical protein